MLADFKNSFTALMRRL